MKKYLLAAIIGGLSTTASAVCQYPLDATAAQYAMANMTPFPYTNLQSVQFTASTVYTPPAIIPGAFYLGLSSNGFQAMVNSASTHQPGGDITLPTSGIVGVEYSIDHFLPASTSGANVGMSLSFATSNASLLSTSPYDDFTFMIVFEAVQDTPTTPNYWSRVHAASHQNGVFHDYISPAQILPQPLPAGFRTGVYFNMNTRQVGYTFNGVDQGYVMNADGTPFTIPASVQSGMLVAEGLNQVFPNDPSSGQLVGASLITDSSQFTQPFPAGTTDICSGGAPVQVLPNGKPFPGKGHAYGLLKQLQAPLNVAK